jgi:KaiC/GvpD/RAD55 family RecA-like ATPase
MPGSVGELPVESVPPGTAVLVTGPPMTGKYGLALSVLAANSDAVVLVSTNRPADRVVEDYRAVAGDVAEAHLGVVDCVSHDERTRSLAESDTVKYVNSPRNLTRIGVAFTGILDSFADAERVGVGLNNVSAFLMYAEEETVYKFLQVFTGQTRNREAVCVAVLDTAADGDRRSLIEQHFDGAIETRENDRGERECRVQDIESGPPAWTRF